MLIEMKCTLVRFPTYVTLVFFQEFFQGGSKIYCCANFFCYAIVFGPNFREGQKFSGGQTASGAPPCGRKPELDLIWQRL